MYKLLIADDETQTREGLVFFIKSNSHDFEVVGSADGGLSALALAGIYEPDVVLTDIRMPDLDGFELTKRLNEFPKKPAIVIMSAYDDVDYFKTAFKVNALDYILKPIDTFELLAVMDKIKKRLDMEAEENKKRELLQIHMKRNLPILRTKFLTDLVDGLYTNMAVMEERMSFLNLSLKENNNYNVVMVSLDSKQSAYNGVNRSMEKALDFGLINLLEELVEMYCEGYVFEYEKGDFVLLLTEEPEIGKDSMDMFKSHGEKLIDSFLNILRTGTNIRATIGIGEYVAGIDSIPVSFRKARENICRRLIFGSNRIIENQEPISFQDESLFHSMEEVKGLISRSDQELLKEGVEGFFLNLARNPNLDVLYGIQCSGMLMMAVLEAFMALHGNLQNKQEDILSAYEKLGKTETIPDMKQVVLDFCMRLNETIRGKMMDQNSEIVKKVKDIIRGGYTENITIQSIAERIYLSPNYVCTVFKQMTGHTINQYITHVRIEAAKKLLEDTSVKLVDIGYLIGYIEPSYFSKIFKKCTALTPKEYRQMIIGMRNTDHSAV